MIKSGLEHISRSLDVISCNEKSFEYLKELSQILIEYSIHLTEIIEDHHEFDIDLEEYLDQFKKTLN